MNSSTTERFRKTFARLPEQVQKQARQAYRLFQIDPYHTGLLFKQIHPIKPIYSVRIGLNHRAVGVRANDKVTWFWIGSHSEYDKLVSQL